MPDGVTRSLSGMWEMVFDMKYEMLYFQYVNQNCFLCQYVKWVKA